LKGLSVERGLLRETESVQDQLRALFKCDVSLHCQSLTMLTTQFLSHEPENEITLTAFRLLILDLLSLFYVMNEGTINILGMTSTLDWPKLTV
jgi:phosphatidylinositol-binding clathrin assembly protein